MVRVSESVGLKKHTHAHTRPFHSGHGLSFRLVFSNLSFLSESRRWLKKLGRLFSNVWWVEQLSRRIVEAKLSIGGSLSTIHKVLYRVPLNFKS